MRALLSILEQSDLLETVYLVHFSDKPIPPILHSLYHRINNLTYLKYKELTSDAMSEARFNSLKLKALTGGSVFTTEEELLLDNLLKAMGAFTQTNDIIDYPDRTPIRGVFFYVLDNVDKAPKIGKYMVVVPFDKKNLAGFKAKYKYILTDKDHLSPSHKQLPLEAAFDLATYKGITARNAPELEILTDSLSIDSLKAVVSK